MDDIIIFTNDIEEHQRITWEVIEILKKNNLYLKLEKCEFKKMMVEYLRVIISHNTLAVDPIKAATVKDWPTPQKLKEVQEFVGFLNFYNRFIKNFSWVACSLYDLTKKDKKFEWTDKRQEAFDKFKELIRSAPILSQVRDHGRFQIEADTCNYATWGILLQDQKGVYHPIAFLSKSLNEVERNYQVHNQEMLVIIRTLEEWWHYIIGKEFDIWSDHKNLSWFMTKQNLNWCQARWGAELAEYHFDLHYHKESVWVNQTPCWDDWT